MLKFLARRLGVMALTMVCLSLVVFYFVNLEPNLGRLAIFQTEMRASDADLESWLTRNGYRDNFFNRDDCHGALLTADRCAGRHARGIAA